MLPDRIVRLIQALPTPRPSGPEDGIVWACTTEGTFSVATAYTYITNTPSDFHAGLAKAIWRWKGPERVRLFLWHVARDSLLTNEKRERRGLSDNLLCPICNQRVESLLHVLRYCNQARVVWQQLSPRRMSALFFSSDHVQWLLANLDQSRQQDWSITFGVTVYHLWLRRNDFIFSQVVVSQVATIQRIRLYVRGHYCY